MNLTIRNEQKLRHYPNGPSRLLLYEALLFALLSSSVQVARGAADLTVSPTKVTLPQGGSQIFTATVTGSKQLLTWSTDGGSLSATTGTMITYTAPNRAGNFTLTVSSQTNSRVPAVASITVSPISIAIVPDALTITSGHVAQFKAVVTGTVNTGVTWKAQEAAGAGSIDQNGTFTAPAVPGTYHLIAASPSDPSRYAVAIVQVVAAPAVLSFVVSPSQIVTGQNASISAVFSGGEAFISDEAGAVVVASAVSGASYPVAPSITRTYKITVTDAAGDSTTATATLTVFQQAVSITGFMAAPSVVDYGGSSQLSWTVSGTPSVLTLSDNLTNTSLNEIGVLPPQVVHPVRRQLWTLAGSNPVGENSQSLTVVARGLDLLAGNLGTVGFLDGTGPAAQFRTISDLAADANGNVYVAIFIDNTIRKITPAGVVTTVAGDPIGPAGAADGSATTARFNNPSGVVVDLAGNIYVSDFNNNTIRKITPGGVVSTLAGSAGNPGSADGAGPAARFDGPASIDKDSQGNLYVPDLNSFTVRKITPDGVVSTLAGSPGLQGSVDGAGSSARFFYPNAIAVDGNGNVFVGETNNHCIRRIDPGGVVTTFAGLCGTPGSADGIGSGARFNSPVELVADSSANIYVADRNNQTIRKVTPQGVVSTIAGVAGTGGFRDGSGVNALFSLPKAIAVDLSQNIYVADNSQTVRKISPQGVVSELAGSPVITGNTDGAGTAAQFDLPWAAAVDTVGNTYVSEYAVHTVRKVTPAGIVTTFGSPGNGGKVDGAASQARFNSPQGLAADGSGNIYVADAGNSSIRKIDPAGNVSTLPGTISALGLARDNAGNFYATAFDHAVYQIKTDGSVRIFAGSPQTGGEVDGPALQALFTYPQGIAADVAGNVYVTSAPISEGSYVASTVRKIATTGMVSTLAGSKQLNGSSDGLGTAALFSSSIRFLAVEAGGNVLVSDTANNTIRRVTPGGLVTTIAGQPNVPRALPGALPGSLYQPMGIATTPAGDLVIVTSNGVMQLTDPGEGTSNILTVTPAEVSVTAGDSVQFAASINGNSNAAVRWSIPAGDVGSISGSISSGGVYTSSTIVPSTGADYHISAQHSDAPMVSGGAVIHVVPTPTLESFSATNTQIYLGQSTSLIGVFSGNGFITDQNGATVVTDVISGAPYLVTPTNNTTYTLTVTNSLGRSVSATIGINVFTDPARIVSFTGTPSVVDFGGAAQIDWNVTGMPLSLNLANNTAGTSVDVLGSPATLSVNPVRRSFYSLTGSNPAGGDSKSLNIAARGLDLLAGDLGGPGDLDGLGPAAHFSQPYRIARDAFGDFYLSDAGNNTIRKMTPDGEVTTFAGTAGLTGNDDGVGAEARFNNPEGLAFDASGNLYVADSLNEVIRKITPSGVVSTFAGSGLIGSDDGQGTAASFASPGDVAIDAAGTLYVADSSNQTIRKITPDGMVSTLAGSPQLLGSTDGLGNAARFEGPSGLVVSPDGNIYVSESGNHIIRKVTPEGLVTTYAGAAASGGKGGNIGSADGTGGAAKFSVLEGITVDPAANLYVADSSNGLIRKIAPGGVVTTIAGSLRDPNGFVFADGPAAQSTFAEPSGVALDRSGNILIVDKDDGLIRKLDVGSAMVSTFAGSRAIIGFDDGAGATAQFEIPAGIALGPFGLAYVVDTANADIRAVDISGKTNTIAGFPGGIGSSDSPFPLFLNPVGIATDGVNLYVADTGNNSIRKLTFNSSGFTTTTTLAGGLSPNAAGSIDDAGRNARFNHPQGVAADASGNVWVADTGNCTIRKVLANGMVSTYAGAAQQYGTADGPGTAARFYAPSAIALGPDGSLFVADSGAFTIRKIATDGMVTTLAGSPGISGSADGAGAAARFTSPGALTLDAEGNIYVADGVTIRKITSAGVVTTIAGQPGKTGVTLGPLPGTLASPRGIAVTSFGDLLVPVAQGIVQITAP